jgi:hypothetical protein
MRKPKRVACEMGYEQPCKTDPTGSVIASAAQYLSIYNNLQTLVHWYTYRLASAKLWHAIPTREQGLTCLARPKPSKRRQCSPTDHIPFWAEKLTVAMPHHAHLWLYGRR